MIPMPLIIWVILSFIWIINIIILVASVSLIVVPCGVPVVVVSWNSVTIGVCWNGAVAVAHHFLVKFGWIVSFTFFIFCDFRLVDWNGVISSGLLKSWVLVEFGE
jgi:hypothetical protein